MSGNGGTHRKFGFGHICGIILLAAAIVLIVGLFVEPPAVGAAGFALFAAGSAMSAVRRYVVAALSPGGTPEFRNSLIVAIAMSAVFALSVAGFILKLTFVF